MLPPPPPLLTQQLNMSAHEKEALICGKNRVQPSRHSLTFDCGRNLQELTCFGPVCQRDVCVRVWVCSPTLSCNMLLCIRIKLTAPKMKTPELAVKLRAMLKTVGKNWGVGGRGVGKRGREGWLWEYHECNVSFHKVRDEVATNDSPRRKSGK